jgi:hypothetical protein
VLRVPDSRTFSRTLAATGLVAGPALFLLDTLIDPAWDSGDANAYLSDVSAHKGVDLTAEVAATIGSLAFVAGAIGLMRLMRGRRVTLGQLGAALLAVGLIGQTASLAFNILDVAMADFHDRKTMAAFRHDLVHNAGYSAYWLTFVLGGIVIGSIVLAIALVRRRIVPLWSPVLLAAGTCVWFVSSEERLVNAVSNVLVLTALLPLALLIWSLSDDEWGEWVVPVRRA